MNSRITDTSEEIDHKTSRAICNAVGERLQRDLHPINAELPSNLRDLMVEIRSQDDAGGGMMSNRNEY